jgi:hypothetical protein
MASLKAYEDLVAELRRTVADLEALVAEQRERLAQAEAALEAERNRPPAIGNFARSTLTHFYGRITKVTPRPDGRAWVEINPYLTPTLPGRSTLDLFDAWELIDDPAGADGAGEATGVEIVTQLTQSLAMFRPATHGISAPQAMTHSLPQAAPQALPQALPAPTSLSDENSSAEAAHGQH